MAIRHMCTQVFSFFCLLMAASHTLAVENAAQSVSNTEESPYQLEKLVVSAAERREMAIRTIRYGLNQPRSTRPEDAEKIVCQFRRKTGTHFWQLICGSNSTWAYWSEENLSQAANSSSGGTRILLDSGGRGRTPYNVKPGKFFGFENVTRGKVKSWIREVTGDDSDELNTDVLEKHLMARAIGFAKSKQGFEIDDIVGYARALKRMRAAERDFEAQHESLTPKGEIRLVEERARMRQEIIEEHGLSIETFDGIDAEMRADPVVRSAVERALQVTI